MWKSVRFALPNLTFMITQPMPYNGPQVAAVYCNVRKEPLNDDAKATKIIHLVSEYFRVNIDLVKGKTRKREIVEARQIAQSLILRFTSLSLKKVGEKFSNRDHSTIIHSKQTVLDLCETDKQYFAKFTTIKTIVEKEIKYI